MLFSSLINNYHAKRLARWQIQYSATVTTKEAYTGWLILPLPHSSDHQEIVGEINFSTPPTLRGTDPVHSNNFAAWQLRLKEGEQLTVNVQMTVARKPTVVSIKSDLIVDFYMNSPTRYYRQYTASNKFIQSGDARVQETATELREGSHSIAELVQRANEYVMSTLKYGDPITGLYTAADALTRQYVDCGGYDSLLVSVLNALGIPARIVSGFWLNTGTTAGEKAMHAWVAVSLPDGTWLPADPSVEQLRKLGRSRKIGSVGTIGSDRLVLSTGCDFHIEITGQKIQIDILQNPVLFP